MNTELVGFTGLLQIKHSVYACLVTQPCPTVQPLNCSLWGSSVHGIFQARILEWVAISYSKGSSWPRDLEISALSGGFFPGGSVGRVSVCNSGDPGLFPDLGRFPEEGKGNPLQDFFLENPTDRGAWQAPFYGLTESDSLSLWAVPSGKPNKHFNHVESFM